MPDAGVTGNVTIYPQDAPFETGLGTLLETHGMKQVREWLQESISTPFRQVIPQLPRSS